MAFLEVVRRYWPAIVIAVALAISHYSVWRSAVTVTQTRADLAAAAHRLEDSFAREFAQVAARGEQQRQQAEADRAQNENHKALEQLQAGYDRAIADDDGLRKQIKRYADAASRSGKDAGVPDSVTGNENPGNMLAVVLDRCVSRVRELAKIADSRGIKRQGAEDLYNAIRSSGENP